MSNKVSDKERSSRRQVSAELVPGLSAAGDPASFNPFDRSNDSGQSAAAGAPITAGSPHGSGAGGRVTAAAAYLRNPAHWWVIALIALVSLGAFGKGLSYLQESAHLQPAERAAAPGNATGAGQGWLSAVNPFVEPPPAPAAIQLSKEYIYAGSRMLAVEDAGASAAPPADLAVWRPSNGYWYVFGGVQGSQQTSVQWGQNGDKPVPGDYDGDGRTDFSIFRPDSGAHSGTWYIYQSGTNSVVGMAFGLDTDKPAMADYDGDGKTDIAVIRPNGNPGNTSWYVLHSSNSTFYPTDFGTNTDVPAPADYDGDGKADIAVWRPGNQTFYVLRSSDGITQAQVMTQNGVPLSGVPVCADYDGDGKADFTLRSGGNWNIRYSSSGVMQPAIGWYQAGYVAVPNDYDGDGKVDVAVWDNATGYWYIRQSSHIGQSNELRQVQWGASGDIPVPAFYRR